METLQKANTYASDVYTAKANGTTIASAETQYSTLQAKV
jgi:hypothetical protein